MNRLFSNDTLFARFMNALGDIIWTGLLWTVCSLPLVTMGAASCAAYQCMVKVVRGKNSGITALFFESFKENIRITLPLKFVGILLILLLGFDCIYLYGYGTDFSKTLSIILYVVVAVDIAVVSYLYPLISRFDESRLDLFKLAFYLTFRHILLSILLILIFVVCIYCTYLMPWSLIVMPGIYWYLMSFPVKRSIAMLAGDKDEENDNIQESLSNELASDDTDDEDGEGKEIKTRTVVVKRRRLKNPWRKKNNEDYALLDDISDDADDDIKAKEEKLFKEIEKEKKEDIKDRIVEKYLESDK